MPDDEQTTVEQCECLRRKALGVLEKLKEKGPAFCAWSDIEHLESFLLAPCPCEGMRQRLADYDEMARLRWHQMGRPEDLYPGGPLAAYDTLFYAARDELANLQGERAVLLVEMQPADGTLIGVAAEMGRLRAQLAHYQRVANGATQVVGDLEAKLAASREREALEEIGVMQTTVDFSAFSAMVRNVVSKALRIATSKHAS